MKTLFTRLSACILVASLVVIGLAGCLGGGLFGDSTPTRHPLSGSWLGEGLSGFYINFEGTRFHPCAYYDLDEDESGEGDNVQLCRIEDGRMTVTYDDGEVVYLYSLSDDGILTLTPEDGEGGETQFRRVSFSRLKSYEEMMAAAQGDSGDAPVVAP